MRAPYLETRSHRACEEKIDLSFADFGDPRRPNTAQSEKSDFEESPNPLIQMARREGFDASLRSSVEPTSAQSKTGRLRHSMAEFEMARREGFEPPTLRFEA